MRRIIILLILLVVLAGACGPRHLLPPTPGHLPHPPGLILP